MFAFVLLFAAAFAEEFYINKGGYWEAVDTTKCYAKTKYIIEGDKAYSTQKYEDDKCTKTAGDKVPGQEEIVKTVPEHKYYVVDGEDKNCGDHNDKIKYLIKEETDSSVNELSVVFNIYLCKSDPDRTNFCNYRNKHAPYRCIYRLIVRFYQGKLRCYCL